VEDEIESYITGTRPDDKPRLSGHGLWSVVLIIRMRRDSYREHLLQSSGVDLRGLKLAIDCDQRRQLRYSTQFIPASGAAVVAIGTEPDGLNINDGCGSTHMEKLCRLVTDEKCDLGIAFDGDADRMLAVGRQRQLVDGDVIMAIIGSYMHDRGLLNKNTIVVTVMSIWAWTFLLMKTVSVGKTAVGDRYVLENMQQHNYSLGASNPAILFCWITPPTGDGMLSALCCVKSTPGDEPTLAEAARIMKVLPQVIKPARVLNVNKEK
jgi:phosphoglucosamine mutase